MIFDERMKDRWNRGTLRFKMLFDSFRYDFRLSRYRRVKRRVISNRLLVGSLASSLTDLSHTDKR